MRRLLDTYRAVAIEDAGPYCADRRHPLVVGGFHELLLRRGEGGVVERIHYRPARREAALTRARQAIDGYGERGFSWIAPAATPVA